MKASHTDKHLLGEHFWGKEAHDGHQIFLSATGKNYMHQWVECNMLYRRYNKWIIHNSTDKRKQDFECIKNMSRIQLKFIFSMVHMDVFPVIRRLRYSYPIGLSSAPDPLFMPVFRVGTLIKSRKQGLMLGKIHVGIIRHRSEAVETHKAQPSDAGDALLWYSFGTEQRRKIAGDRSVSNLAHIGLSTVSGFGGV